MSIFFGAKKRTKRNIHSLTFSGAEKEAKSCPFSLAQRKERKETSTPTKSPPILGDLTENRGNRRFIRVLVWLTKPVPLRGEPWSFYRLRATFLIIYTIENTGVWGRAPRLQECLIFTNLVLETAVKAQFPGCLMNGR